MGRLLSVSDVEQRFWKHVKNGPIPDYRPDLGPCVLWTGALNPKGYGQINTGSTATRRSVVKQAHRVAYELFVGPIPDGLQIDHLCRVRSCVRPSHLEVVTAVENIRRGSNMGKRKPYCPQGHPYDEANSYIAPNGDRSCRACNRERALAYYHRKVKHGSCK